MQISDIIDSVSDNINSTFNRAITPLLSLQ